MTIRHTVIWKLKAEDAAEKALAAADVHDRVMKLADAIPLVHNLSVRATHPGRASSGDVILEAEFDSFEDLEAYLAHPEHVAGGEYVKQLVSAGLTVDYEY